MSSGDRRTTTAVPDMSSDLQTRRTLSAYNFANTMGLRSNKPSTRQTVSGAMADRIEPFNTGRPTIGRATRIGLPAINNIKNEVQTSARTIVEFAISNGVNIPKLDTQRDPVDAIMPLYLIDLFKVFECAVNTGIDPDYHMSPPPSKDVKTDIREAKSAHMKQCLNHFNLILKLLNYSDYTEVEKNVIPRLESFQNWPPKTSNMFLKALAYIINLVQVCFLIFFEQIIYFLCSFIVISY